MAMVDMHAAAERQGGRAQQIESFRRSLGDIACLTSQDELRSRVTRLLLVQPRAGAAAG